MKKAITLFAAVICVAVSCGQKADPQAQAKQWAETLIQEKGITLSFAPITNFVELKRQYEANTELWDASFAFLAETCQKLSPLDTLGTFPIVGTDCYTTLSRFIPNPVEKTKLEGHRKYIDIQVVEGSVNWGVYPADGEGLETLSEYNPEKDNGFYKAAGEIKYVQTEPEIFIFFPNDLHNPSYAADNVEYAQPVNKIVIKVANAE